MLNFATVSFLLITYSFDGNNNYPSRYGYYQVIIVIGKYEVFRSLPYHLKNMTAYYVVLLFLYNLLFASKIMLQPLHLKCTVLRSAKSLSRLISKLVKQSTVCRWRHSKELLCHFQKSFYLQQTSFSLALKFSKLILLTFHTTSSLFSNLDLISKYSTIFKSVTLSKCLSSKNNQILDLRNHRIQSSRN